jgi:tetratricopeptide (TPR) repeat protein
LSVTLATHGQDTGPRKPREQLDRAIAGYTESIRHDPKNAVLFISRACAWSERGDLDKAIADFTEAIRLDPKSSLAHIYRGRIWSDRHDAQRAIADFTKAIRIDPRPETGLPIETHLNAYFERATAKLMKRSFKSIISDLDQAIRIDGTNRLALMLRAAFRDILGDRKGAAADRAILQRLEPNQCSDCSGASELSVLGMLNSP